MPARSGSRSVMSSVSFVLLCRQKPTRDLSPNQRKRRRRRGLKGRTAFFANARVEIMAFNDLNDVRARLSEVISSRLGAYLDGNAVGRSNEYYLAMADYELDYESEYQSSALSFEVPNLLLLGGGPTNVSDRVRRALGSQCLGPMSPPMNKIMDEVKMMAKYIFQTKNELTFALQTSGNGGNEAIINNLLDPREKIIVAIGGTWGDKQVDMAMRRKLDVLALRKPPGEIFTYEELEAAIISHKADLLFVTHGESTGGIIQQVDGLGDLCHKHGCLLAVDAIVSIGVDPLFVDRWKIDAVTAGSQKAIGAPPGMCLLSFSPRAIERMNTRKHLPPYYMDVKRLGMYWNCFEGSTQVYHYTYSSNMVAALREALAQMCEEGLPNMWARHRKNARLFWEKVEKIGMEIFVEKPKNRFHGVTCVNVPKEFDQTEFLDYLRTHFRIDITPGHGPTLNKAIRVGLMGQNSRPEVVDYLIDALKDALKNCKRKTENGGI